MNRGLLAYLILVAARALGLGAVALTSAIDERERAEAEDRPSKKKLKKADKDEETIKKREKKIDEKEQKLLAAIKAPPGGPSPTADPRS